MKCSNAAFGEQNKMKRNISNGEWDEWGEEIFGRQLISIKKTIILISPYGSNDLLIRFTHAAVRQFEKVFCLGWKNALGALATHNKMICSKRRMKRMGRINKMNKSREFTTLVSFAYNL